MKNKRNVTAGIIILFLGILVLGGIIFYAARITANTPRYFVTSKESVASALYDDLTSTDLDVAYPDSPEAVMDMYNKTVLLLYGDMIIDESIRQNVLSIQRQLYSNTILENNTFETQYENLVSFTNELHTLKAVTTQLERQDTFFDPEKKLAEQGQCIVSVKQYITTLGIAYWNYYLDKIDGQWKITTWVMTDSHYRPIS